jgi:hypothetical protein
VFDTPSCVGCSPTRVSCAGTDIWAKAGVFAIVDPASQTAVAAACDDTAACQPFCAVELSAANCSALVASQASVRCVPQDDTSALATGYCELHNRCEPGRQGFMCGGCSEGATKKKLESLATSTDLWRGRRVQ